MWSSFRSSALLGPKTGYPSDETGKIVAENIVRVTKGKTKLKRKAWGKIPGICVMDAGKKEVIIMSDHLFKPRNFAIMIPNVIYDFSKVLLKSTSCGRPGTGIRNCHNWPNSIENHFERSGFFVFGHWFLFIGFCFFQTHKW